MCKKCAFPDADPVVVTPEMIDAGVRAYYANAVGGWDNPGTEELREMMREIFKAMSVRQNQ